MRKKSLAGIACGILLASGLYSQEAEAGYFAEHKAQSLMNNTTKEDPTKGTIAKYVAEQNLKLDHNNLPGVVDLAVFVDDEYVSFHKKKWKEGIEQHIITLNKCFAEFGIEFRIGEISYLDSMDKIYSLTRIMAQAELRDNGSMDMVLIFSGENEGMGAVGRAYVGGRYALVTYGAFEAHATVHEIGHIFGAEDNTSEEASIMCYTANSSLTWADESRAKITKNKNRSWNYIPKATTESMNKRLDSIEDDIEKRVMEMAYLLDKPMAKGAYTVEVANDDTKREFFKLAVEMYPDNYYFNYVYAKSLGDNEAREYYLKAYSSMPTNEDREVLSSIYFNLNKIGQDQEIVKEIKTLLDKTSPW